MQIQLFTIPILGGDRITDEMNIFLRSKKILQVESQLVNQGQGTFWCFCVKYINETEKNYKQRRKKIDYKEILDEQSFGRFSKMREIRRNISKEEAIPAFAVFTDEELAGLAKIEGTLTPAKMRTVKGIGQKKVEKYGHHFTNTSIPDEES